MSDSIVWDFYKAYGDFLDIASKLNQLDYKEKMKQYRGIRWLINQSKEMIKTYRDFAKVKRAIKKVGYDEIALIEYLQNKRNK